ncbi:hypothetical protein PG993_014938 [Apiospora rasikravindrae]|uniref:Major facilitator superfamily (MFS) profile domain-containing protein n=1 Tax=Apiospora rasikravindrae TaxID=990691 RepID=A0ABR1RP62_9PEZI
MNSRRERPDGADAAPSAVLGAKHDAEKAPQRVEDSASRPEPPYSIFTHDEKVWISSLASFGAMFSTLSSYIYFPALVPMATDFGVSLTLINLTVTSYLVVAGIAPAFMGDLADQGGRRLAYIVMFILLFASNIGIALQTSYAGLLVLRMVQSAGSSGKTIRTYGASYGVLADITTIKLGRLLAAISTNAAPSFGPVVAGVLTQKLGWRWIFWFLSVLPGVYLLVIILLLPETQRKIVGNGSIRTSGFRRSIFGLFVRDRTREAASPPPRKRHYHIPNPFVCIKLLCDKANLSVICIGSITYTVKMALQTSLAAQCVDIYRLDYLQAGLVYIPSGVGGAMGSYVTGKFLNRNIQRFALRYGLENGHYQKGNDISGFPIEKARFRGFYPMLVISALGTMAYGVCLLEKTMCGTLLTDLNPTVSATVQASYNLVRCIGAGVGIAIQQPLDDAVGPGWCFGIYAIVLLLEIPFGYVLLKHGQRWRQPKS